MLKLGKGLAMTMAPSPEDGADTGMDLAMTGAVSPETMDPMKPAAEVVSEAGKALSRSLTAVFSSVGAKPVAEMANDRRKHMTPTIGIRG